MLRLACLPLFILAISANLSAKSKPESSVRPFQIPDDDGEWVNVCTAWRTMRQGQGVWVTAAHCSYEYVVGEDGEQTIKSWDGPKVKIDGKGIALIERHIVEDVAVYTGGPGADPLTVAFRVPDAKAPIWTAGFPHGSAVPHVLTGVLSAPAEGEGMVVQLPSMGGMSGAPMLDSSDLVIGMMRGKECSQQGGWCAVGFGIPAQTLRRVLSL